MKLYDYKLGDDLELNLLIKGAAERETKTGNPFLTLTFQDESGDITGIRWGVTPEEVEMFQPGKVARVKANRIEHNGQAQLKLHKLELVPESDEASDPDLYVKRAPLSKQEMRNKFNTVFKKITDPTMNKIIVELIKKHNEDFFRSPAAKSNHHAFAGGLAYHTLCMLEIAEAIVRIYDNINESLIYSGIILHDLAKVIELSGATATEYTLKGQLIGHIVLIDQQITDACLKLEIDPEDESVLMLRHAVLAHHGELEYGSPVRPQVKEAEIIHYIDQLDAKINMMEDALEKVEPGEFTDKVWALENRRFYKPTLSQPADTEE